MKLFSRKQRNVGTAKKQKDRKSRGMNERMLELEAKNEVLQDRVDDFMSYFDPRGGISQVPLGPFDRTRELLT